MPPSAIYMNSDVITIRQYETYGIFMYIDICGINSINGSSHISHNNSWGIAT